MSGWTALLLAGSRPGGDPFAAARGVEAKALIPVGGVPMAARVAEALLACPEIGRIVVLTDRRDALRAALPPSSRIEVAASAGSIAETVRRFAGADLAPWPLFVTTADHALLTPETVAGFLARVRASDDVAVGVVERAVVRSRFPGSRRTWIKLRGGWWTGANLFALTGPRALELVSWWADVEQERKKGWRLLAKLGPGLLIQALTRRLSMEEVMRALGGRVGLSVKAVPLDDPLAAVDVDKPSDLALAEEVVAGRA